MNEPEAILTNARGKKRPLISHGDFVGAGFKKIDPKYLEDNAPRVDWDKALHGRTPEQKMLFLKKFSSSMNYAASMISIERDQLARFLLKKEQQLNKLMKAMEDNNAMIQQQVTQMNEDRQKYNKHVADLNKAVLREDRYLVQIGDVAYVVV